MKAHTTDLHCQSKGNAKNKENYFKKTNKQTKTKENATKPPCAKLLFVTTDISEIFNLLLL